MKWNFLDNAIAFVSPKTAVARLQSRARLGAVQMMYSKIQEGQKRKYDAASKGRHYGDWITPELSVNQEVLYALATLRNRARDLGRNNGYAINAIRAIRNNVVGTGIVCTPIIEGGGKNQAKALKKAWQKWSSKTGCDFDGMNTYYGIQALIMKTIAESGECLVRRIYGTSKDDVPLKLQVLEGDFINSAHHNGMWQEDGTMLYYGIKFNKNGERLGYWLFKHHPSEFGAASEFVDAKDIDHLYDVERPNQIRGVPLSCGVMTRLRDLDDYEFTERVRNKIAAAYAVFVTTDVDDQNQGQPGEEHLERIEPGMIKTLLPGQQIQTAVPPMNQGYSEYVKSNLRGISAGLGTSYELLTNDYSNVNFSSGRMGWLEFNRNIEHLQWNLMIPRFCDVTFGWFVEACQLKGIISYNAEVDATWTPPRRQMIDPYKEVMAIREELRAGLTSWQDVARTYGYNPDDLMEELKKDGKMWDDLGLMPTSDPRFDANRPPQELPGEQQEPPDPDAEPSDEPPGTAKKK